MRPRRIVASSLFVIAVFAMSYGEWYYVAPTGDDSAAGDSPRTAWRSIPHALASINAGDALMVDSGVYSLDDTGGYRMDGLSNCWIMTERPGEAIISFAWKEARNGEVTWESVGNGIFRAPDPSSLHTTALWGSTFLQRLPLDALVNDTLVFTRNSNTYNYRFPPHGFAVEADGYVYVRLPGNADPNGESIIFQRSLGDSVANQGLFTVTKCENMVIDGLVFEGIHETALAATSPGNDGMVVRNCRFKMCRAGLTLRWSDGVLVEWNEYSFPGYDAYITAVRSLNTRREDDGDIPFVMGKKFFDNEGGLAISSKVADYTCRFNYAHDSFDGFSFGGGVNADFHHNVMWNLGDNGVETDYCPSAWDPSMRIHHNLFVHAKKGAISQQYLDTSVNIIPGSMHVYRNVIVGYAASGWYPWTVIKGFSQFWRDGYHVFNNTVWVKRACLFSLGSSQTSAAAQLSPRFRNNLLVFTKELQDCYNYASLLPDSQVAANLVASAADASFITINGGAQVGTMAEVHFASPDFGMSDDGDNGNDQWNFALTAGSPAVDAGVALPSDYPSLNSVGPIDIGAVEYGVDGDEYGVPYDMNWPRPRTAVFAGVVPDGHRLPAVRGDRNSGRSLGAPASRRVGVAPDGTIRFGQGAPATLVLRDLRGRAVMQRRLGTEAQTVRIDAAAGLFLIEAHSEGRSPVRVRAVLPGK